MSLAADARAAVRERPYLLEALRAGVVNYSAAARTIDVAADEEAVATALRRFADRLPPRTVEPHRAAVTIHSGIGPAENADEALLSVNGHGYRSDAGNLTAVIATGEVDAAALGHVLGRLATAGIDVDAAAQAGEALCVVVARRDGPAAVEAMESALSAVPDPTV